MKEDYSKLSLTELMALREEKLRELERIKEKKTNLRLNFLENELKRQREEINKLNKTKKRSKWWLAYLLWNSH